MRDDSNGMRYPAEGVNLRVIPERLESSERRTCQGWPGAALALVLALLVAPVKAGQQPGSQGRLRTTVEMVVVPVTVKNSQGNLVTDLRRDEFRVFEDGVEQPIASFSTDPVPLSAVVLIDNNLPQKTAAQLQKSAVALAGGFSESDEVALVVFDQYPQTVFALTADKDHVFTQLKRLHLDSYFPGEGSAAMTRGPRINANPVGPGVHVPPATRADRRGKNIDDAVYAAAQALRNRPRERRKIIFLISDGNNSRDNTMSFKDTLRGLLSADISVYAIDLAPGLLGGETNVLARYARLTGGDIFQANKRAELEQLYSRVTDQARNQYTLGYVPPPADPSREFHTIEVRVRRPDLTLLARDGYFTGGSP